jgi:hypothetical protein
MVYNVYAKLLTNNAECLIRYILHGCQKERLFYFYSANAHSIMPVSFAQYTKTRKQLQ